MGNTTDSLPLAQGFRSTSILWRLAMVLFLIGYVCHVISFGAPYWMKSTDDTTQTTFSYGIWNKCTTLDDCSFIGQTTACLNALRVFGSLALMAGAILTPLLLVFIRSRTHRRAINITCVSLCFVEGLSTQIMLTIYAKTSGCVGGTDYSWCWALGLSLASLVCMGVALFSFLVEELRRCTREDNFQTTDTSKTDTKDRVTNDGKKQIRGKNNNKEKTDKNKVSIMSVEDW